MSSRKDPLYGYTAKFNDILTRLAEVERQVAPTSRRTAPAAMSLSEIVAEISTLQNATNDTLFRSLSALERRLQEHEILYGGYFKTPEGFWGEGVAKMLEKEKQPLATPQPAVHNHEVGEHRPIPCPACTSQRIPWTHSKEMKEYMASTSPTRTITPGQAEAIFVESVRTQYPVGNVLAGLDTHKISITLADHINGLLLTKKVE